MKTIEAVELYNVLSRVKMYGIPAMDGMGVVATTAALRKVVDTYNAARETAFDQILPPDYNELGMKAFENKEALAAGEEAVMTAEEMARLEKYNHAVELGMKVAMKDINEAEADVIIKHIAPETFAKICDLEANKELTIVETAVLYQLVNE